MTNQRFTETLSTGIVTDNMTGKEYKCEMRIDDELLKLLNELDEKYVDEYALRETLQQELQRVEEENKQLRQQINELQFNKTIGQQEYQRRVFYE